MHKKGVETVCVWGGGGKAGVNIGEGCDSGEGGDRGEVQYQDQRFLLQVGVPHPLHPQQPSPQMLNHQKANQQPSMSR